MARTPLPTTNVIWLPLFDIELSFKLWVDMLVSVISVFVWKWDIEVIIIKMVIAKAKVLAIVMAAFCLVHLDISSSTDPCLGIPLPLLLPALLLSSLSCHSRSGAALRLLAPLAG